jgi:preprotein translocase subunit YajC
MPEFLLLIVVMTLALGAYWSLVIFPKQRDFSKRQRFVRALAAGDEVITAGGIIGRVVDIRAEEGVAYVEITDGLIVRVITASLLGQFDPEELARNVRMAEVDGEAER